MDSKRKLSLVRGSLTHIGFPQLFDEVLEENGGPVIKGHWTNELDHALFDGPSSSLIGKIDDNSGSGRGMNNPGFPLPVADVDLSKQDEESAYLDTCITGVIGAYKVEDDRVLPYIRRIFDIYDSDWSDEDFETYEKECYDIALHLIGLRIPELRSKYLEAIKYDLMMELFPVEDGTEATQKIIDYLTLNLDKFISKLGKTLSDHATITSYGDKWWTKISGNDWYQLSDSACRAGSVAISIGSKENSKNFIHTLNFPLSIQTSVLSEKEISNSDLYLSDNNSCGVIFVMNDDTKEVYAIVQDVFTYDHHLTDAIWNEFGESLKEGSGLIPVFIDKEIVFVDPDLTFEEQGYGPIYYNQYYSSSPDDELCTYAYPSVLWPYYTHCDTERPWIVSH